MESIKRTVNDWLDIRSIAYGPDDRQKLDVYPVRTTEPNPVIIFFYGGSWRSGDRSLYRFVGSIFRRRGFVVVISDYRVYPTIKFPAFMDDAAAVVRWTRSEISQFGGDSDRIMLMGHSAGAHMGALLLTNETFLDVQGLSPSIVKRFVGMSGPYSFDPLKYDSTADIFSTAENIDDARPIANVSGDEPPMLLMHGAEDTTVLPVNTTELADAVKDRGGQAAHVIYPELAHSGILLSMLAPLRWRAPVLRDCVHFLKTGEPPRPKPAP